MKNLLLVLIVLAILSFAQAQHVNADQSKEDALVELMDVMQYDAVLGQMISRISDETARALVDIIRQKNPEISDEIVQELKGLVEESMVGIKPDLLSLFGNLLLKHYDANDIRNMTQFYRTDTGQKSLRIMPEIAAETTRATAAILQATQPNLQRRIQELLIENGYDL